MRSRLIALGLVLGVLALSGCFVLDEIDSGQQVMKKHSPRVRAEEAKKKQAPAAPAAEEEGTGLLASVKGWWSEMRSPAKAEGRPAWDPAADAAFVTRLREKLCRPERVRELDLHLYTREFARAAVDEFTRLHASRDLSLAEAHL